MSRPVVATAIRFEPALHDRLRAEATDRGWSVNWLVNRAVADFLPRLLPLDQIVFTVDSPGPGTGRRHPAEHDVAALLARFIRTQAEGAVTPLDEWVDLATGMAQVLGGAGTSREPGR